MRNKDVSRGNDLENALVDFDHNVQSLLGIRDANHRWAFIEQLLESIHRIDFFSVIEARSISSDRACPASAIFDPIRAAILKRRANDLEEACWLTFLGIHFGKNKRSGWKLARDVYSGLDRGTYWTWQEIQHNVIEFRLWIDSNKARLKDRGGKFGNHRKYESLDGHSQAGTGNVVASYVSWIASSGSHAELLRNAYVTSNDDPHRSFEILYQSMSCVKRFGRTGKFDYLSMLGKLRLANIAPGSTFMCGATGPYKGANLLFFGDSNRNSRRVDLDRDLLRLGESLRLGSFAMQILEDALCNWQKSPSEFMPFRG